MHSTSHSRRFTSQNRLRGPSSYKRVLSSRFRGATGELRWYASTKKDAVPSLGMATPRRFLKTATKRNRVKRLIRESFRKHKQMLLNKDVIILVRGPVADERRLTLELDRLWQRISEIRVNNNKEKEAGTMV